jgi:hypothetical protein
MIDFENSLPNIPACSLHTALTQDVATRQNRLWYLPKATQTGKVAFDSARSERRSQEVISHDSAVVLRQSIGISIDQLEQLGVLVMDILVDLFDPVMEKGVRLKPCLIRTTGENLASGCLVTFSV